MFKKKEKENKYVPIGTGEIHRAYETLQSYKAGKASVDARIVENEQWWKLRHYSGSETEASAWLFNAVINRHADAMDNFPEVICLPREERDKNGARLLTQVLPVILEENRFESTYSDCWYDKLKSGSACYGVFWNKNLDRGAGNIDVRRVDMLNLFWEPGVTDIQKSKNLFHVELWDNDALRHQYPVLADSLSTPAFESVRYLYDDAVDTSDKSALIDWYYKKNGAVHFAKFCNGVLLYASENDSEYAERGFYDHGKYPFVIDVMYPIQGSPCGFGLIDAMRGTQSQIDSLGSAIMDNAKMAAKRRYFVRTDGAVNEEEFADWSKSFVHYSGSGDPSSSIFPINNPVLSQVYVSILNNKIDELKETSGNRDFSQGSTSGGVTAASAIEALQEAGNKTSRDMIGASYRCYEEICAIAIELIRQFYTVSRTFRITGDDGSYSFISCKGDSLCSEGWTPVFDIKVRAHKKSAYSRAAANELALQLYQLGVFSPEHSFEAGLCLDMMEFEGKDDIVRRLREIGGAAL